jgi:hypothetical protein
MQIRSQDKTMYQADESSRKALSNNTKIFSYICENEYAYVKKLDNTFT